MKKTFVFPQLGNKRFDVELRDANKEKRNRSYSQASDCCGTALKQEKKCSMCGKLVSEKTQRKIVKIGKEEHLCDAAALEKATETLEEMGAELQVDAVLDTIPEGAEDRYDALLYASPISEKAKDASSYKELREILKGRVAVAHGVFRSNEFQVLLGVGDDGVVRVRKLVEESQRYGFDAASISYVDEAELNAELLAIEKQVLVKKKVDAFDVSRFKDSRAKYEENVIEELVLNGKMPEVIVSPVHEEKVQDEIAKMKALLE